MGTSLRRSKAPNWDISLRRSEAPNWDIRRGPDEDSRAGISAWVERFPARTLCLALTWQPEFWEHVASIRDGAKADELARRYIRRDQGRRLELIATLLERAAEAPDDSEARMRMWNAGLTAYTVDGVPSTSSPQRALRPDALMRFGIGATSIARRGAGRCVADDCPDRRRDGLGERRASTRPLRCLRGPPARITQALSW